MHDLCSWMSPRMCRPPTLDVVSKVGKSPQRSGTQGSWPWEATQAEASMWHEVKPVVVSGFAPALQNASTEEFIAEERLLTSSCFPYSPWNPLRLLVGAGHGGLCGPKTLLTTCGNHVLGLEVRISSQPRKELILKFQPAGKICTQRLALFLHVHTST